MAGAEIVQQFPLEIAARTTSPALAPPPAAARRIPARRVFAAQFLCSKYYPQSREQGKREPPRNSRFKSACFSGFRNKSRALRGLTRKTTGGRDAAAAVHARRSPAGGAASLFRTAKKNLTTSPTLTADRIVPSRTPLKS